MTQDMTLYHLNGLSGRQSDYLQAVEVFKNCCALCHIFVQLVFKEMNSVDPVLRSHQKVFAWELSARTPDGIVVRLQRLVNSKVNNEIDRELEERKSK